MHTLDLFQDGSLLLKEEEDTLSSSPVLRPSQFARVGTFKDHYHLPPLLLFDRHWPPATLNLNLTHTPRLSVFPLQAMLAMLFPLQAMLVSLFPRVDFSWLLFPSVSLQAMLAWGAAHGYRWQVQDAGDMAGPLKGITPLHLAALLEVSHLQSVLS